MVENPFAPPRSHVADTDEPSKPGSVWKGMLIGGALDIIGTTVLIIVVFILFTAFNVSPDMSPEDIEGLGEQFAQELTSIDSVWGLVSFSLGSGLSLLGGYVCAIFARERWKMAALMLGIAVAVFGLISGADSYSLGENLSLSLLTFVLIYAGGWLREGRR